MGRKIYLCFSISILFEYFAFGTYDFFFILKHFKKDLQEIINSANTDINCVPDLVLGRKDEDMKRHSIFPGRTHSDWRLQKNL